VLALATKFFPTNDKSAESYCNKPEKFREISEKADHLLSENGLLEKLVMKKKQPQAGDVKYVFVTKVGPGPINVSPEESLLDNTGNYREPGPGHKRLQIA
jgi:hypothetical protein